MLDLVLGQYLVLLLVLNLVSLMVKNLDFVMVHYLEKYLDNLSVLEQVNYLVMGNMMEHW